MFRKLRNQPLIRSSTVTQYLAVCDLGIYIDYGLTMQSHVRQTAYRCFAVLRQLRTVRRQVPTSVFQSLIVALVLSRLDYCNSVLFGLPANLIQRLQSVQNAAARLIFRIRRSEHITPVLISLHWLCVPERISFKLAVMTYRSIHGTFQSYISAFPTWHPDDGCGLLPYIVWTFRRFVSLQSAGGRFRFRMPPSGTTCLSTSHLRRHSRFSDNDSTPLCFPVSTKTLSDNSCVTITIHHYCLDTRGPCNNEHYLGHVKNVYDDDDWLARAPYQIKVLGGHWLAIYRSLCLLFNVVRYATLDIVLVRPLFFQT